MSKGFGDGATALLVDDESVVLAALTEILSDEGFDVTCAPSVGEARRLLDGRPFDLAILDKNLPDGSGLEIAKSIVDSEHDTAVVILTGYANLTSAVEGLRLGVADYIGKPFDIDDLSVRLKRALDTQRLRRRNEALTQELTEKNAVLEQLATRDPLTQLSNHAHFQESLEREIHRAQRSKSPLSLLLFDLDDFKKVNDSGGHQKGDRILKQVAEVLKGSIRLTDQKFRLRDQDIPARYGGDEFAIILPDTPKTGAVVLAERLRESVSTPEVMGDEMAVIAISIGVSSCPGDATERAELIGHADTALYAAKRTGRNRTVAFSPGLKEVAGLTTDPAAIREIGMIRALDDCIENSRFRFVYQPLVELESWSIYAYEALMRPEHPELKGPLDVVATAERAGRIHALGRVLRKGAAAALRELPDDQLMFINLNPLDIHDPELLALEPFFEGRAQRIVLEITETDAIRDFRRARERVKTLQDLGFRVAIDDFGSGYSGLNSLALLEPDYAKLDMALVRGIAKDNRLGRLVEHLLEFCADEGMKVVAEGVETEAELDVVHALGCPLVQGYYFAKPAAPFAGIRPKP